jgi:Dyp-type peroxidase family
MAGAPVTLDRDDIQGIITSAYPRLGHARFLFFRIANRAAAKSWLRAVHSTIRTAAERYRDEPTGLNVALTARGLDAVGLPRDAQRTFPREFRQGMYFEDRAITLGDLGASHPDHWLFGRDEPRLDVAVLAYAQTPELLEQVCRPYREAPAGADGHAERGLGLLHTIDTRELIGQKEHFGFRDGIAQPLVEGFSGARITDDGHPADYAGDRRIKSGEFVLGYPNEYGRCPHSPSLASDDDPRGQLGALPDSEGTRRDLGQNGSFLVVRQLSQDVARFWSYCRSAGTSASDARAIAEKMVGRTLDGLPLSEPGAGMGPFGYKGDLEGHRCPVGAHVRRTNPREALPGGTDDSLVVSRRHRILRRGRSYGPPVEGDPTIDDGQARGLAFLAVNANIRRQFEFIQQAWVASTKFAGLADEDDPIIGQRTFTKRVFSIPGAAKGCGVRRRLLDLPTFVRVMGGGYFFLPGIRVLRFLADP